MTYEARHHRGINLALAAAVLLLSLLGFVANGLIPTESTRVGGTYPLVGWLIVAACVLAAAVFIKRAFDGSVQARVDERGVYAKRLGAEPVPWADISGFHVLRAGIQRIARFDRMSRPLRRSLFLSCPRSRRTSRLLVIWNARQLLRQIQPVINKHVHTHACDLRILQEYGQRRLTRTEFIAGDAGLKEFFTQAQAADHLIL